MDFQRLQLIGKTKHLQERIREEERLRKLSQITPLQDQQRPLFNQKQPIFTCKGKYLQPSHSQSLEF